MNDASWNTPTRLILARLSFGYQVDILSNKLQFGFILTPIAKFSSTLSSSAGTYSLQSEAIGNNNELTFYNLAGAGSGYRFYLPKLLVQYKFC